MSLNSHITLCFVLTACLTVGCGGTDFGPMGQVSGKVTLNGATVAQGTQLVFMQMEKGYAGFGMTDAEGKYTLEWRREGKYFDGLPVGVYKVMIQPPVAVDVEELDADAMLAGGGDVAVTKPEFDRKYRQTATSGLEFTITEGANTCDIDLK